MDVNAINEHIKSLKEIVLDEKRLVTYVSLSKELCLHVNDTKVLMNGFLNEIKGKRPDYSLNINYILSGLCTDSTARTIICTDLELKEVKKSFQIIFYEHVYSISFGKSQVDSVSIMAANSFEDLILCKGIVNNNSCSARIPDEIDNLKCAVNAPSCTKQENESIKSRVKEELLKSRVKEELLKNTTTNKSNKHNKDKKSESKTTDDSKSVKEEFKTKPKNGIEGFFNKKGDSSNISQDSSKPEEIHLNLSTKNKVKAGIKNEPKKGIAGFFNNQSESSNIKSTEKSGISCNDTGNQNILQKNIKKELEPVMMDVDETVNNSKDSTAPQTSTKESKPSKVNGKGDSNKHNLSKIKKNAKVDKKRKRVLTVSESESDDESNDPFKDSEMKLADIKNDSEDEIPPTPTVNTVKITSGIINPRKKRKIVDKTYTDEDGYILTKKEEVYESCSDNDENIPKDNQQTVVEVKKELSLKGNKPKTTSKKNKVTTSPKGKQATLTSFFKRV